VKALVLSALGVDGERGAATLRALEAALAARACDIEVVDCLSADIAPCTGCGSCGLRTPGECVVKDDMQQVFRRLVASDVLVLATPVRFGSYCAALKKVVDRFQPLMVPLYVVRGGEMHFRGRYDLPRIVGVGLSQEPAEAEAFRFLIGRLAVNVDTPYAATAFSGTDADLVHAELARVLDEVAEVHS
jgi:multimeric flavodoxin WrbA